MQHEYFLEKLIIFYIIEEVRVDAFKNHFRSLAYFTSLRLCPSNSSHFLSVNVSVSVPSFFMSSRSSHFLAPLL